MCWKNIKIVFSRAPRRFVQFYSNVIAGLFASTVVGIFFAMAAPAEFKGWITFENFGWIQYLIYTLGTLAVTWIYYKTGKAVLLGVGESQNFILNYCAGFFSAIFASLFILYHEQLFFLIALALVMIVLFFIVSYFVLAWNMGKKKD